MSEKAKLTPEELQQFQDIRNNVFETISILGDLNYRKTLIDFEIQALNEVIKQNAIKEKTLLRGFGQKYGDGSINGDTGEIAPL